MKKKVDKDGQTAPPKVVTLDASTEPNQKTPLGALLVKYQNTKNPVTKAVYREIIKKRIDAEDLDII